MITYNRTCKVCGTEFYAAPKRKNANACSRKCFGVYYSGRKANRYTHGGYLENRPEYNSWRAMVSRCNYPKYWCYDRYGGRGITVCDRWLGKKGFVNFLSDMGKKPSSKHSLDRVDNDGNYTPENCQWSDQKKQVRNSSKMKYVTVNGVTKPLTYWFTEYSIHASTFYRRKKRTGDTSEAIIADYIGI